MKRYAIEFSVKEVTLCGETFGEEVAGRTTSCVGDLESMERFLDVAAAAIDRRMENLGYPPRRPELEEKE